MTEQNYNRGQRRMAEKFIKKEFGKAVPHKLEYTPPSLDRLFELANEAHHGKFEQIPFAKRVRSMLEKKYCEEQEYHVFAQRICREYIQGRKFEESWVVLYYLELIIFLIGRDLDKSQKMRGEVKLEEQVIFGPIHALILEFARNTFTHYTPASRKTYLEWIESIDIVPIRTMFDDLDRIMLNFHYRMELGQKMGEYMRNELHLSDEEALDLRDSTDALFRELKQLQRYTIKQSYYLDEMNADPIHGWVCLDPAQIRNAEKLSPEALNIANRSNNFVAEYVPFREASGMGGIAASHFTEGPRIGTEYSFDAITSLECKVGHDGELYVFVYPIKISLRDIYKKGGMEAQYEFMRLQFIARLFDLVVPRVISAQTPSMDDLSGRVLQEKNDAPMKKTSKILRDIITPRIFILRDKKKIQEAYDIEVNMHKRQFLGRVGHPMRVRAGYRPHPDARQWAKEDGFYRELDDNETWCRPVDSPAPVVHRQKGRGEKRKEEE